jgi:hypothetical protein
MGKVTASSLGFAEEDQSYPGFTNAETAHVWHLLRKSPALTIHAQALIVETYHAFHLEDPQAAISTAADQLQHLVEATFPEASPVEANALIQRALHKNVNWIELQARLFAASPNEPTLHRLEYVDLHVDGPRGTYQYSPWFAYHLRIYPHTHSRQVVVGFLHTTGEQRLQELIVRGNTPVDVLLQTGQRFFVEITLAPLEHRHIAYVQTSSRGVEWDGKMNGHRDPFSFALHQTVDFVDESAHPPRDEVVDALLLTIERLEDRSSLVYPNSAFLAEKTLAFFRSRGYIHEDIGLTDFVCSRGETTWVVEAMGGQGNLRDALPDFQFALGRLLSRYADLGICYGLTFPDDFAYVQRCTEFWDGLRQKLNLHFFFVQPNGMVRVEPSGTEI